MATDRRENHIRKVRDYWDSHHLGTQFLQERQAHVGSVEYFKEFDRLMERWEYKNRLIDWIADQSPSGALLEIGCGLGQDLTKFAKKGLSVVGMDLAHSVAGMASRHLKAYSTSGSVMQADAENLPFSDGRFDLVYSCGVLQHTPRIQRAVDEIHRALRGGGVAVVIVYYRYSWFNLLSIIGRVNIEFEDEDAPIINKYSKKELYQIFSNFSDVQIRLEYCYPRPTPRKGGMARLYNRVCVPILHRIPYFLMRHFGWHAVVIAKK